ncbi:MAG: hypothetical protein IT424_13845 [Pirellulales bacterium]|nr:hypothetical protein [Pirellulales bacterium]
MPPSASPASPTPPAAPPQAPPVQTESNQPASPVEAPAEGPQKPDAQSLFGPGAAAEVLAEPGGWSSQSDRLWTDAAGDALAPARLVEITGNHATLKTNDGGRHRIAYRELSRGDLAFLRRQIDARQSLLRETAERGARLAKGGQ